MQKPGLHIVKPASDVHSDNTHGEKDSGPEIPEPAADSDISRPVANAFLSWLRFSLAFGSVLAIITLIFLSLLSAVFIAVDPPAVPSDAPVAESPPDEAGQTDEPLSFHSFYEADLAPVTAVRSNFRRRRARARVSVKGYKMTRQPRRRPEPLVPLFMPTTLVIYVDNGVIKTRTEPWLQTTSSPKKKP